MTETHVYLNRNVYFKNQKKKRRYQYLNISCAQVHNYLIGVL